MYVNGDELNMAIKDDPYYIELGNRIRKIREGKKLSREELAELTGLAYKRNRACGKSCAAEDAGSNH